MKKVKLELRDGKDRCALHNYLARELSLPAYYGKNLDALYECLAEYPEPLCVGIYTGGSALKDRYLSRVIQVFKDAEAENERLCVFFFFGRDRRR